MAVPEQTPYKEYTANGVTTSFALGFICDSKNDLIVMVGEIEPPIATWSLTGGNVVFTTAPTAGQKITLQRNTPFNRTAEYQSFNNSFRPQTVNVDFDRIWLKLQELGVADWLMKLYVDRLHQQQEQKINDLKGYVDDRDDELRAYLLEEIRKQGVALDQLDEYYNYLMQRLAQIAVDKGWEASFVVDASGKTQQQINDTLDFKNRPEFHGGVGDGVTIDNTAFISLLATNPNSIELNPSATYLLDSATTPTFTDSCVINGNGATIIMDQRWNLQKTPMWGSFLSEAAVKGQTVLKMAFMTNYAVGAEVLVFQNLGLGGAAIDPYFASVQDDVDNGDYSSHINYITAVDTVNKTITLRTPLQFNAPIQTAIYVTTSKKLVFKNVNFIFQGDTAAYRMLDNCDNIAFKDCTLREKAGLNAGVSLRLNTCYKVLFNRCDSKGIIISCEYGSNFCGMIDSTMAASGFGDALFTAWCAATNCFSVRNKYLASDFMYTGSITAGVYFGAKSRNCVSMDDDVSGLPFGYRAQWGAVNAQFIRPAYRNPTGSYSLFSDYSHNTHVIDGKFYDKPVRTVGVYGLVMRGNLLDSGWRGEAIPIPLMLDLNRSTDTTMVRPDYVIEGNKVIGGARTWVALKDSVLANNMMTYFRTTNGGTFTNLKVSGNTFGNFLLQHSVGTSFTDNTVDDAILQSGTGIGNDAAVKFDYEAVANMSGNTIRHPSVGLLTGHPSSFVNAITESNNRIFAPTPRNTGVTDTAQPTIASGAAQLYRGQEYRSSVIGSNVVWRYNGTSWVKGYSSYPQITYTQPSFANTPNGLTTFPTTRTIQGAAVGETVLVSTNSSDIGEANGKYFARVTAANTVTVYYQDKTGVEATVPFLDITLTLVK